LERVQYDETTKQQILVRVAAGEPYRTVAEDVGIPAGTVYSWINRARKASGNGEAPGACMQSDACMQESALRPKRKRRHVPTVKNADGKGFILGQIPDDYRCTAKSKRTGQRCKQPKADGYEVCRYHGAGGGPPPGTKNALKTGEKEAIWFDTLTEEEQALIAQVDLDKLAQVNNDLRLVDIRIRRMLQRIANLAKVEYTVVAQRFERKTESTKLKDSEGIETGAKIIDIVDKEVADNEGTLGQIQAIEEALTRVQAQKIRLLDLKHKIDSGGEGGKNLLDEILDEEGLGDE
ncbi:MAG: helix-turn-helix domain-containing protein, partial [Clostridia bacterium]|nr:helix-turn-helix domain-containing protein [Clostridia bacterium]